MWWRSRTRVMAALAHNSRVMPGLVPGIHAGPLVRSAASAPRRLGVDGRHKAGHDEKRGTSWVASGIALAGALALGGCFQPMYGNFAAGGPGLQTEMQAIAIEPIPDRIGHYLGDDLVLEFNGTGSTPPSKYRLAVALNEAVQTPLIDTVSGRASSATVVINADYKLVDIASGNEITKGKAFVMKSYDRTSERFANIRAARDAEIHDAQQLADQLRIRIASALSARNVAPTQ